MQKDLIDRSELIKCLEEGVWNDVLKVVKEQPTAYNVKQVLEEIEEYSRRVYGEISAVKVMSIVRKGGKK